MSKIEFKESAYEILGITKKEIANAKKSYVEMVRKYPPEREPEMFNKIREAYEQISKPNDKKYSFVLYKEPLKIFEDKISKQKLDKKILKTVFETPFATNLEITELAKTDKFKS